MQNTDLSKFWNPKLRVENILSENKVALSLNVYKTESGIAYIVEKRLIKGSFNEILELKHFPFDCQVLYYYLFIILIIKTLYLTMNLFYIYFYYNISYFYKQQYIYLWYTQL